MSTGELPGTEQPGSLPPEAQVPLKQAPLASGVAALPQAAASPGVGPASARAPGAPTLPDFDPARLAVLLSELAKELLASPGAASPSLLPASAAPSPSTGLLEVPGGLVPSVVPPSSLPPSTEVPPPSEGSFGEILRFPLLGDPLGGASPYFLPAAGERGLDSHGDPPRIEAHELDPLAGVPLRSLVGGGFDPYALRREFPILEERIHGNRLVWLDSAATTQKPQAVIDRVSHFYEHENSNVHRGAHTLAARATDAYEGARETTRRFLNAPSSREIVFVRGATEGINLVAQSWGRRNVAAGDEILVTWLEHHANIVPWQQVCSEKGARLRVAPVDDRGQVILEEYEKRLGPRTRLVAFAQVSNALGTITPAREMIEMAHRHGARVLVDGAQAVSHFPVDVQLLDCDFYVFSGHKIFAPTGIGVVFGKSDVLDAMPPWQGGGNMIQDVTFERTVYQPPPARFEAGTSSIADAAGLGAALDWLSRVGRENVARHERDLLAYATERLATVPGLTMIGAAPEKAGVLSFVLDGQRTEDVGGILDREGIAVRAGHHCAQPIHRRFGLESTVRASLGPYNVCEDIDALVAALHRLQAGRGPH